MEMKRGFILFAGLFVLATSTVGSVAFAQSSGTINSKISKLTKRVKKLEVTLESALKGRSASSSSAGVRSTSSWSGTIYKPASTGVDENGITVTFTPTSTTQGTWTSNPYSLTHPVLSFSEGQPTGTFNGEYRIIENSMFLYNVTGPEGFPSGTAASVVVSVEVGSLLLSSFSSSLPSPLMQLNEVTP